jgi:hypothetical protein
MADNITTIVGDINNTISGSLNISGGYPSLNSGVYPSFDNINQTVILNQTYLSGQQGAIPMPMFLLLAGVAFILLILAFKEPLRIEGSINVSKVGLSLCGTIMSIAGALTSFTIVENMGSSVSTYGTYTVSVSSYIIWNSVYFTGALITSSVLCFVMLVYTLIQPETLTTPEKRDYKSNVTGDGDKK